MFQGGIEKDQWHEIVQSLLLSLVIFQQKQI